MALLLSGERPAVAAVTLNPFRALGRWVAKARAARARRIAIDALLEFDSYRLDDLGLNRADLFHALQESPDRAGRELSARRAERARSWRRF